MKDQDELTTVGWIALFLLVAVGAGVLVSAWAYLTSNYP